SYRDRLAGTTEAELADLCATAATRRSHHDHRLAVLGSTVGELGEALGAFLAGTAHPGAVSGRRIGGRNPKVVFVFSGQGGQWPGMGADLLDEPVFREAIEACDRAMRPHTDWRLLDYLVAAGPAGATWQERVDVIQPVLCAFQIALAQLWRSWGIEPAAVAGHSMGEVAAAHVAGALSLEAACAIICTRSRLLRQVSGRGAMAVVDLPVDAAREAIAGCADRLAIAASNSPRSTVLSGDPEALGTVLAALERREVFCKPVKVDVASHSPQMDPLCEQLPSLLGAVQPSRTRLPLCSTVTGQVCRGPELTADYWAHNLRQCVQFARVIQDLAGQGSQAFLEISPHPILSHAIEECVSPASGPARPPVVLPSLRREEAARAVLLNSLGALYALGQDVAWPSVAGRPRRVVSLPSYPWQKERFWAPAPALSRQESAAPRPEPASPQPAPAPPQPVPTTAVSEYYDLGAEFHRRRPGDDSLTFDGYLTWGLFPRPRSGVSWLRTVLHPERHPEDHRCLVEAQEELRRVLF
ncbi:MAG: acyltransferase domain-containing protein, partial [Chloroflexota bacterium]